ncbi:MAG: 1-acyl-sn-glycerol-3-phosphate acyltransferase [Chitinophagales bacterium]|nr:1-acyl-sn-glycerol-3-phosphate acyltransferase [Chitinophagales bacterium]
MIWIFRWLFKLKGWKLQTEMIHQYKQSIVLAAPHTSNWDAIIALAAFSLMGLKVRFTLKKEWFRFPFKRMMTNLGGIAIDRTPKKVGEERLSMVDAMVNLFNENKDLHIMITPEGTRSLRTEWKTGFYYAAHKAKVPILCGYLDYKKKIAGIGKIIDSSLPLEECMKQMMDFYKTINGKFPEKFSVDKRYA